MKNNKIIILFFTLSAVFCGCSGNRYIAASHGETLTTPEPAKPVEASTLVGNWKAKRPDGKTIALNLSNDGKYTWTFAQKDKPQAFSGDYSVADNLLVLKQAGTPMMVGQVTPTAADGFNFKLPGDNPDDPGLTFGK